VEALCDELTRQHAFIAAHELLTWPDGTATVRYAFRHILYRVSGFLMVAEGM
jgi:hypothetical protein